MSKHSLAHMYRDSVVYAYGSGIVTGATIALTIVFLSVLRWVWRHPFARVAPCLLWSLGAGQSGGRGRRPGVLHFSSAAA